MKSDRPSKTTSSPSDRRRKSLRRPSIQHRIKHALEEILHNIQSNITRSAIDGCEHEQARRHEPTREHHCPFAAGAREVVAEDAEEHADYARCVDGQVGAVGVFDAEV